MDAKIGTTYLTQTAKTLQSISLWHVDEDGQKGGLVVNVSLLGVKNDEQYSLKVTAKHKNYKKTQEYSLDSSSFDGGNNKLFDGGYSVSSFLPFTMDFYIGMNTIKVELITAEKVVDQQTINFYVNK